MASQQSSSNQPQQSTLLDIPALAQNCSEQTSRFFRGGDADNQYCFELFRRAILHRNAYAWEMLTRQYTPLLTSWVQRHEQMRLLDDGPEEFVSRALLQFWRAVDAEKFANFANLESILSYLKMCAWSAVAMEARKKRVEVRDLETARGVASKADPADRLQASDLWQQIRAVCKTDAEAQLAECAFVFDMKAAEIAAAHPTHFDSVKQVYRLKENLTARLRRNRAILAILQGDA